MTAHEIGNVMQVARKVVDERLDSALRQQNQQQLRQEPTLDTASVIEEYIPKARRSSGGINVRGTPILYGVIVARAYLISDNSLVAVGTEYDEDTMYLYPTWDYVRAMP